MAEPLTSSDIIRERLGFGPTSPDEKRRAAGGGISPLGTMERIRFEEGRGLSPMASKSEKEAYLASEVMAGRRDPMELPKSYGGLGERPEATTRRQFRMQQEWDKRYEMMKEEQKVARDLEKYNQQYQLQLDQEERMQRDQDMDLQAKLAESARENEVQREASLMMDAMKGAIAPDGKVIARPIRPEDDDAIERLNNLAGQFKYGIENKAVGSMFEMLYRDAMKFREDQMKQSEQNELAAIDLSIKTRKPFNEFGTYDERGMFQPRAQGMIAGEQQIKAEEETKTERQKELSETKKETKEQGLSILEEINKIDSEIRKADFDASREKNKTKRDEFIANSDFYRKERDALVERLNKLTPQSFNTKEEAEASNLPKGTIVVIGGRRARID